MFRNKFSSRWRVAPWVAAMLTCMATAHAAEPIVVGRTLPLSGPLASYGHEKMAGADLMISSENAKGGIGGRPIKVITLDDRYDPEIAAQNARTLKEQQALLLLNSLGVGPVARLLPTVEELKLPTIGLSSGSPEVRKPLRRYVFPVLADYNDEASFTVRQLEVLAITSVILLEQEDNFGKAVADAYRAALQQSTKVRLLTTLKVKRDGPVSDAVAQALRAAPQSILIATVAAPAADFLIAYRAGGGGAFAYAMSVTNASQLAQMTAASRGTGFSQIVPLPTSRTKQVVREYGDLCVKHGLEPTYYGLEGFIEAKVAIESLKRATKPISSEGLVDALASLSSLDLGDFEVTYGKASRVGSRYVEMITIGPGGRLMK